MLTIFIIFQSDLLQLIKSKLQPCLLMLDQGGCERKWQMHSLTILHGQTLANSTKPGLSFQL
jgi:hypothetical protein